MMTSLLQFACVMTLRRIFLTMFTHQREPSRWRFAWLTMPLLLIAVQVVLWVRYVPAEHSADYHPDRISGLVVALMLLLNCLASDFRWSVRGTVAVRVLALLWLVFGSAYILSAV
jgi:hypothetical protein